MTPRQQAEKILADQLADSRLTNEDLVSAIATSIEVAKGKVLADTDARIKAIADQFGKFLGACGYAWEIDFGRYVGDEYRTIGGGHGSGEPQ